MNIGESLIFEYYKNKGYFVNKNGSKGKEKGLPDLTMKKNNERFFVEEKMDCAGITDKQEIKFIELINSGNKILIAKTNRIIRKIRLYELNKLFETKFLFEIKIPKNFKPKSLFKCYYCGERVLVNKEKNHSEDYAKHRKECRLKWKKY